MDNQEVMDRMVDLEQEVLRLKDDNRELKEKLELERAKAVSRHDFIASFFTGEL